MRNSLAFTMEFAVLQRIPQKQDILTWFFCRTPAMPARMPAVNSLWGSLQQEKYLCFGSVKSAWAHLVFKRSWRRETIRFECPADCAYFCNLVSFSLILSNCFWHSTNSEYCLECLLRLTRNRSIWLDALDRSCYPRNESVPFSQGNSDKITFNYLKWWLLLKFNWILITEHLTRRKNFIYR